MPRFRDNGFLTLDDQDTTRIGRCCADCGSPIYGSRKRELCGDCSEDDDTSSLFDRADRFDFGDRESLGG